jgi:hypothetical protein
VLLNGSNVLEFRLSVTWLPSIVNTDIKIVVTAPWLRPGHTIFKYRRFMRALPPVGGAVPVQVDHAHRSLLVDGQLFFGTGWFGDLQQSPGIKHWSPSSAGGSWKMGANAADEMIRTQATLGDNILMAYGLDEVNASLQLRFLDQCAAVGIKVLCPLGEPLSGGAAAFNASEDVTNHIVRTVTAVANHSAIIGYYICDDCCASHVSVSGQAKLYNMIKTLDPYHIIVGALQCYGAFWQWTDVMSEEAPGKPTVGAVIPVGEQPRLQLSLDVIMWEDYHQFDYPQLSDATAAGEIRRGAWFEPIINCYGLYMRPYPGETEHETIHPNSPVATRTSLWLSVLQQDTPMQLTFILDGDAWAPPQWRSDNGWLQTVAVQGWAAEAKMLTPSLMPLFGSDALNGTDEQMVVVQSVELLSASKKNDCNPGEQNCGPSGYSTSPLVARGFREDCTNTSGICVHVVVANLAKTSPAKFTLSIRLPAAPNASNVTQPPLASRLFGNGGYDVNFMCRTDCVEGVIDDYIGAADTVVYEIGCTGPRAVDGQAWEGCANRRVRCSDFMWGCSH